MKKTLSNNLDLLERAILTITKTRGYAKNSTDCISYINK
jgi:hypothetical protein